MLDYIPWPAFRELAVQIPDMQEHMEWLLDMSNTICCEWSFPDQEPFHKNKETDSLDLCETGKVCRRHKQSRASVIIVHRDSQNLVAMFLSHSETSNANRFPEFHARPIELVGRTVIQRLCK